MSAEARALVVVAVCGLALWGLIHLGGEMREGETLGFDRDLMMALRAPGRPHTPIGPSWLPDAMRDVTALGSTALITLATLTAAAALLYRRRWGRAFVLLLVVVLASASDDLLKVFYNRARPDFAVAGLYIRSQSFPSGHSTASAALWLTLATIAASFEARTDAKVFWFVTAVLAILAVGFSRVYLGAHWPTDVVAGWILGAMWALIGWAAWRWLSPRLPDG
jgi:undecaprenyl-diphosphatase